MKYLLSIFTGFILFSANLKAEDKIIVEKYKYWGNIPVNRPVLVDSLDVNGEKFSGKALLKTDISFDKFHSNNQTIETDTLGFIRIPGKKGKDTFHLFSFNVDAGNYYSGAQLEITGTGMFEVFVNGKKEKSNTYIAKDFDDADPAYINLTLEPKRYEIIVKYLLSGEKPDTLQLKSVLNNVRNPDQISVSADAKRAITMNDIIEGNRLVRSAISPSGKYYFASYSNFYPTEKTISNIELREVKNNQLIFRFPTYITPYWAPQTDHIYFWRTGETESDLYRLNPSNMEEKIICGGLKVESSVISPDEKYMIVRIEDKGPAQTGSFKRFLSPDDRTGNWRDRTSLYRYSFEDGTLERLTFGKSDTYLSDISEDSQELLFYSKEDDYAERPFSRTSIYKLNLQTLVVDTLVYNEKYINRAYFSPDKKKILFLGMPESFNKTGQNILPGQIANSSDKQAFIMDLSTKEVKPVTRNFNPSIESAAWSVYDNKIYFKVQDEDREQVYCYDPDTDKFEKLPLQEDIISSFTLSKSSAASLYAGQSVSNSTRLYAYDLKSKRSVLLSDPFKDQLAEIKLGSVSDWSFVTDDQTEIKGRYYLPPDFDPDKKYPLIVYYYAGTTPVERTFEGRYPLHVYAALGYVVYTLQPSGTIGFGQEFSARHVNAWGQRTADEIIQGTEQFCATHGFVDKTKIGCIGASYGGFMTQYLQTKTDLFAAAVSHAGISNIASYWGEGYWGYSYGGSASADSYPWNNPKLYVEQSPLFHADKINTPLLLLHGGSDINVPIGESIQMFNALKILGKTVEFIQVDGENHAITNYKKRLEWNNTIFAWFARWLKNEPEWWNKMYPKTYE